MLYIVRLSDRQYAEKCRAEYTEVDEFTYTWNIGNEVPSFAGGDKFRDVVEIQADGHELLYIGRHFTNLPMSKSKIVTWSAPWAQFIYDNL